MDEILKRYNDRSYLIEAIHDILDKKDEKGLGDEEIRKIAKHFKTSVAEVLGVLTFYSMFPVKLKVKHTIRVCVSPACYIKGSRELVEFLKSYLGCDENNVSRDGLFLVEEVECLGLCDIAPAVMIDNKIFGNLDKEKLKTVIEENR